MTTPTLRPFAVVTGASSGIGYALSRTFATNGFDLLIAAEDAAIFSIAQELQRMGVQAQGLQVDLADYDGVQRLYLAIQASGRSVDAVALNAGVGVSGDFARQTDLKDELTMINLNIISSVHLAKLVVRGMVARGSGRLLFTLSAAAAMPAPLQAVHGACESFLLSFSEALRNELRDTGVTVTALMPGPTDTKFFHRAGLDDTRLGTSKKEDPAEVAQLGFEALMAGDDKVITGSLAGRLRDAANGLLPEVLQAEAQRRLAEHGPASR